jgi:hypothetical protein
MAKDTEKASGQPGDCSDAQAKCLAEIQHYMISTYSGVRKQLWDDWFLLRFCRAREFQVAKVKIMLDNYVKYYQENDIENIHWVNRDLSNYQAILSANIQKSIFGFTKCGMPVVTESRRFWKDYTLVGEIPMEHYRSLFMLEQENFQKIILPIASKLAGRRIDKYCLIFDYKDAPLKQFFDGKIR